MRLLVRLGALVGCSLLGCTAAAPPPPAATPPGPSVRLVGEVVGIRLQNINKAAGLFTWNVELLVRVTSGAPPPGPARAPVPPSTEPAPLPVRLPERIAWTALTPADQAALAPAGPQHVHTVQRWRGDVVGAPFDEDVVFTGPDLAHRIAVVRR